MIKIEKKKGKPRKPFALDSIAGVKPPKQKNPSLTAGKNRQFNKKITLAKVGAKNDHSD